MNRPVEPLVSAFVITYNQKNYVRAAVEGLVRQDYLNLEVIVSDDGSTDGTQEELKKLAVEYPARLRLLLNTENVGITANCNRALRACKGEFIAFIGGDDVALPGKIRAQVDWFLGDTNRVLCGHDTEHITASGTPLGTYERCAESSGRGPTNYLRRRRILSCTSTMVRASACPKSGFDTSIPIASDYLFWVEVLMSGGEYGAIDGVYANRRVHLKSVTRLRRPEMYEDLEKSFRIVETRYPEYAHLCRKMIVRNVIYYRGVELLAGRRKRDARERFLSAIKADPLFFKSYVRYFQSFV